MFNQDILVELDLHERQQQVHRDILLDKRRRANYIETSLRNKLLDAYIDKYENKMRVNY